MSQACIETFDKESIDEVCSFTGEELYKVIYTEQNIGAFTELNDKKKWTQEECINYLDGRIQWCKKVRENNYKWSAYYSTSSKCPPNFGRQYASGIQKLPKEIRGYLTDLNYTDVDMTNCHPVLLIHLFKTEGLPVPTILQQYCDNRENILHTNNITKLDVLATINKDRLYNIDNDWLHLLHKELKVLKDKLWDKHPNLRAPSTKRQSHKKSSVMNKLLCNQESIILEMVLDKLRIINPVKMFDGFMYKHNDRYETNNKMLENLNGLTEEWNIKWTVKDPQPFIYPTDRVFTPYVRPGCLIHLTPEEINHIDNHIDVNEERTYESVKKKFEETNFMVLYPLQYCKIHINADGLETLYRYDRTKLLNTYESLFFEFIFTDEKGVTHTSLKPFVKSWLIDESHRTYECIDFLPPPLFCPPNTYNLYRGMRYELLEKKGVVADDDIDVFLNHIRLLSGEQETDRVYTYMLNYFAHMIQFPGKIPTTGMIINSPQGFGKNIFFDNFGFKVLGQEAVLSTANADRFIGRWRKVISKFLGVYNEASCKDTFGVEGKLKELITEPILDWEEKGKEPVTVRNFVRMIALTNKDNPIAVETSDRRWQVIEITGTAETPEYFSRLGQAFENDAKILGFVNYLKKIDISKWNAQRDRVETDYYKSLKSINVAPRERFLAQFALNLTDAPGEIIYSPTDFYKLYVEYMEKKGYKPESVTMFGMKMKNQKIWEGGIRFKKSNVRRYHFDKKVLIDILLKRGALCEDELGADDDVFIEEV